jgi:hypothetical protein
MSFLKAEQKKDYLHRIVGVRGCFQTPAGRVDFLEVKARLGKNEIDNESRLTRFLKPVREALATSEMDFNHLLNRDLDDHRVATALIPYLLSSQPQGGPAFFPPIVAVVLPVEVSLRTEQLPSKTDIESFEEETGDWKGYEFPEAFTYEWLWEKQSHEPHPIPIGRVRWNEERCQLVVIDGQHRAMAMLAIDRTRNNQWQGHGEKYRGFYEAAVREALPKDNAQWQPIEIPVTLVCFPDLKTAEEHVRAARKLFVDVNKNARPPSQSRLILLSDSQLTSIFTRATLNALRTADDQLPLYAVEYDHPEKEQAQASKWSAVTNVTVINDLIQRAIFGPERAFEQLAFPLGGFGRAGETAMCGRKSLNVSDVLPTAIMHEGLSFAREKIDNESFPQSVQPTLEKQFKSGWGQLVMSAISDLLPFRAHSDALRDLKEGWTTADSVSALAKDAMFEGVGMYWTLKDGFLHWSEANRIARLAGAAPKARTDVVNAWEATETKRAEFSKLRAKRYVGDDKDATVRRVDAVFDVFRTHACQLGFVLAVRGLAHQTGVGFDGIKVFVETFIEAANAALSANAGISTDRRFVFDKNVKSPLNLIGKLEPGHARLMRCLWLELLSTKESRAILLSERHADQVPTRTEQKLQEYAAAARVVYRDFLIAEQKKAIKKSQPDIGEAELREQSARLATKQLKQGLTKWCSVSEKDFKEWLNAAVRQPPYAGADDEDITSEEAEGADMDEPDEPSGGKVSFE